MRFSWIAIAELEKDAHKRIPENDYLRTTANPGFLKAIGITSDRAYRPWAILPGVEVWQELARRINKEVGGTAVGRTSVLKLSDPGSSTSLTYSFAIRVYRPNILAIEVHLKDELDVSIEEAFEIRQLDNHKSAYEVVDSLIGIIRSGVVRPHPTRNSFISRPIIYMPVDVPLEDFGEWRADRKSVIANLAINNSNFLAADPALADAVFAANKDVDIKFSAGAFSLINKQGIITAFARKSASISAHMPDEHLKRVRFLEFALVVRAFLSQYTSYRNESEDTADFLYYLVAPVIQPNMVFSKSVNGTFIWKILSNELALSSSMENPGNDIIALAGQKFSQFAVIDSKEYDSFGFEELIFKSLRGFRKNFFEIAYEKHKSIFWIATSTITIAAALLKLLIK